MRPDVEDYAELDGDEIAPRSRAFSLVVLVLALGSFGALAYYAYQSGDKQHGDGEMLIVQAEDTPIKQVPADPEGEQFANQDKTIYDVIAPSNGGSAAVQSEKLLPEPEAPLNVRPSEEEAAAPETAPATANAAPSTTTFVNEQVAVVQSAEKPSAPVAAPESQKAAPLGAPTFVNEVPVATKAVKKEAPAAEKTEIAAKPKAEPKPAAVKEPKKQAASGGGSQQVQLGAFKSEAEAQAAWKKISAKFGSTLGAAHWVVQADLPSGTFYRLRAGSFASAEAAKSACAVLSSQGQACFPVK